MRPVFDTNVFVEYSDFITDDDIEKMTLSVVVLYEPTATTIDNTDLKKYKMWRRQFEKDNLLLVPTLSDWWECAKVVMRVRRGEKASSHGKTPKDPHAHRLQNDALIAWTVHTNDCYVVTSNVKDFKKLTPYTKFKLVSAKDYFGL